MNFRVRLIAACFGLYGCLSLSSGLAAGLVPVDDLAWDESAVRRVLHVFAYGGHTTDQQISDWAAMAPPVAIQEMLTFDCVNPKLSPVEDITADYCGLEALQNFWSSDSIANPVRPDLRNRYQLTRFRSSDGKYVLNAASLQNTWIDLINKRGANPFRQKVGMWLTNYQMAVNLADVKAPLIRAHYDDSISALENNASFDQVLATGATSAAVAREYGHQNNRYISSQDRLIVNDDFAREFHQLFFNILGLNEDPDYHENVTIEHTAWALTGMQIDKETNLYGSDLSQDWWKAPIDFTNHTDASGRVVNNVSRHYPLDVEILHSQITGGTAEQKIFDLAQVAIEHQDSLDILPVTIVNFFADDNLTEDKILQIRQTWQGMPSKDLLSFLHAYTTSTAFHREDTFKYHTAFSRNLIIHSLNTVNNEEAYSNSYYPRSVMARQGAEVFRPAHDVFGGQTSLNAANNPDLFKEAYNGAVDFPNRLARTRQAFDGPGGVAVVWLKDWAQVIPDTGGVYPVKEVGKWLWQRFVGDGWTNYKSVEKAYITCLLATGYDCDYLQNPGNPNVPATAADLNTLMGNLEMDELALESPIVATRREANRRVGLAVNFISMTPFMFATQGRLALADPQPTQCDTDGDNFANICDGDLNNDGGVNTLDLNIYRLAHRSQVGDAAYNPDADFNCDGAINTLDLNIYRGLHRKPLGSACPVNP